MTYREALKMTRNRVKWNHKSRRLFSKYGKLDHFTYNETWDGDYCCWYGDDYITVGEDDQKVYYIVDNKESYKNLKYMLDLEIQIRYKNDTH